MKARGILRRCGRMFLALARDLGTGAQIMGTFAGGMPPAPGVFMCDPYPQPDPDSGADRRRGPTAPESPNPAAGEGVGGPVPGHPERLIPNTPPEPEERALWSQFR
ncbi:DUF6059 family protein [Streptomyces sp. NPDC088400]|uniref:DUF6059 family protein n=1 Tax=Streptomyces sp. NPDC088400 TaxID=3365861 RepID=UPI00381FD61B